MRRRSVRLAAVLLSPLGGLAGCGGVTHAPKLNQLPLLSGARIVAQARDCDRGAHPFCGLELVVVDPRYPSSDALLEGEHHKLRDLGWLGVDADTADEKAAESPNKSLRVTYAAAYGDLKDIDLGWIKRSRTVAIALSRTMFDRSPAISLLLDAGPS